MFQTWRTALTSYFNHNKVEVIGLLLVFLASLGLRFYHIDELLPFTYDQGRDMYVLQQITRGDLTLIGPTTGLPGVFLGPYFYYALLPGFIMGAGSPFAVIKWQILVICLCLPLFYFILKPLVGRLWAAIGYAMLVVTPGSLEQSRQIWNPSWVVPTLLISIWCLFNSRRHPWLLIPALLFYGFSLQTELAYTFFLAPLFGIWVAYYWLSTKSIYTWKTVILASAAFGLTLLPQIVFDLRNQFLITNSVLAEMGSPDKKVPLAQIWAERPAQIKAELRRSLTGNAPGTAWWVGAVGVALLGVIYTQFKSKPRVSTKTAPSLFLLGYMVLPLGLMMLHTGNYGNFFDYYITAHYVPAIAMIIMAASYLPYQKLVAGFIVAAWAYIAIINTHIYKIENFHYSADLQIQALQFARQNHQSDQVALEVFVPNLVPVSYQYLSEWLAQTGQAQPMPFGITDQKEYFLIYEPAISDGSKVAFEPWYKKLTENARCEDKKTFGITTVEHCYSLTQPGSSVPAAKP